MALFLYTCQIYKVLSFKNIQSYLPTKFTKFYLWIFYVLSCCGQYTFVELNVYVSSWDGWRSLIILLVFTLLRYFLFFIFFTLFWPRTNLSPGLWAESMFTGYAGKKILYLYLPRLMEIEVISRYIHILIIILVISLYCPQIATIWL